VPAGKVVACASRLPDETRGGEDLITVQVVCTCTRLSVCTTKSSAVHE
jgi:hypothetical protein